MSTSYTIASPSAVPAVSSYLETIGRTPMVRLSNRTLPKEAIENNVTVLCIVVSPQLADRTIPPQVNAPRRNASLILLQTTSVT